MATYRQILESLNLNEVSASDQAKKAGLKWSGQAWVDKKGNAVAKTVDNKLVYIDKEKPKKEKPSPEKEPKPEPEKEPSKLSDKEKDSLRSKDHETADRQLAFNKQEMAVEVQRIKDVEAFSTELGQGSAKEIAKMRRG